MCDWYAQTRAPASSVRLSWAAAPPTGRKAERGAPVEQPERQGSHCDTSGLLQLCFPQPPPPMVEREGDLGVPLLPSDLWVSWRCFRCRVRSQSSASVGRRCLRHSSRRDHGCESHASDLRASWAFRPRGATRQARAPPSDDSACVRRCVNTLVGAGARIGQAALHRQRPRRRPAVCLGADRPREQSGSRLMRVLVALAPPA